MRLFKPGLSLTSASSAVAHGLRSGAGAGAGAGAGLEFPLTPELLLPESFGDIFLGETFRSAPAPPCGVCCMSCVKCDVLRCAVLCPN